jgi:hypothetical protein
MFNELVHNYNRGLKSIKFFWNLFQFLKIGDH